MTELCRMEHELYGESCSNKRREEQCKLIFDLAEFPAVFF